MDEPWPSLTEDASSEEQILVLEELARELQQKADTFEDLWRDRKQPEGLGDVIKWNGADSKRWRLASVVIAYQDASATLFDRAKDLRDDL